MRAPKPVILIAMQVLLSITLTACTSNNESTGGLPDMDLTEQITRDDNMSDENEDKQCLPPGFIPLVESIRLLENGLDFVFFETSVNFIDADDICIYVTNENNESFIVRYNDTYFVDAEKFNELVVLADATYLARNRLYTVGDPVGIRFRSFSHRKATLTVIDVSYVDSYGLSELSDDEWLCIIKVNLEVDYGGLYDTEYYELHKVAWEYFDYAGNANGCRFNEVLQDDSDDVIAVRLPRGEKLQYLYITSPVYAFKGISRVIDLNP